MLKRLSVITILFAFLFNGIAFSQAKEMPTNIGLFGGLGLNMHSTSFAGSVDFPPYNQSATSPGGFFGIIGNFPINETYTISGRLGYNSLYGQLSSNTESQTTTTIDAHYDYIEISPILQLHNLISNTPVYFLAGLELGVPMNMKYDATVTNPSQTQSLTNIDVPDQKLTRIAIALGAGYIIDLTKNIFLMPEVSYRLPLSKVSNNIDFPDWNIGQLRLGVNLTFGLAKYEEPVTETKENYYMNVETPQISYYDEKMNPRPVDKIKVEEVQYTELFPLIPYIFFPNGESVPTAETQVLSAQNAAGEFSISKLPPDAMKINSYTLDIIGSRMKENKYSDMTVTGTLNSKELKTNKKLAKERADFVKNYLVGNYGVDASRINAIGGGFPTKPSNKNDAMGDIENSRAEITTKDPEILKPIIISADKERITTPQIINFNVGISTNDTIAYWALKYYQAGNEISKFDGEGMPKNISWQIGPNQLEASQTPVDWEFTAKSKNGLSKTIDGSIPVDYFSFSRKKTENLPDKIISKFSLVLFDFDSPVLSEQDKAIIDKYIVPAISANSTIQIYGYTDIIGDPDYNKTLATKRAESVHKYLESKVKNVQYQTFGVGESVLIFNNNLTTGRQLSRTVQIYVVTPKK